MLIELGVIKMSEIFHQRKLTFPSAVNDCVIYAQSMTGGSWQKQFNTKKCTTNFYLLL